MVGRLVRGGLQEKEGLSLFKCGSGRELADTQTWNTE